MMSAFSRGLLFRPQCALKSPRNLRAFYQPDGCHHQHRFFSPGSVLLAAKKTRSPPGTKMVIPTNKPSYTPDKQSASIQGTSYESYASTLARKNHPTLLYVAPSHTGLILGSYSAAFFCFTYATLNFRPLYLFPPDGLSNWVPLMHGGICFMMAAFGTYLIFTPSSIVRTITAIPTTTRPVAGSSRRPPQLNIEIELRKMLPVPFFPARKIYVAPEEIVMDSLISRPTNRALSSSEARVIRLEEEEAHRKELEYKQQHVVTAPFRSLSRGFFGMFKALARTVTREGFLKLRVKGRIYKLDISSGWALDKGKAIDRLATLRPKM